MLKYFLLRRARRLLFRALPFSPVATRKSTSKCLPGSLFMVAPVVNTSIKVCERESRDADAVQISRRRPINTRYPRILLFTGKDGAARRMRAYCRGSLCAGSVRACAKVGCHKLHRSLSLLTAYLAARERTYTPATTRDIGRRNRAPFPSACDPGGTNARSRTILMITTVGTTLDIGFLGGGRTFYTVQWVFVSKRVFRMPFLQRSPFRVLICCCSKNISSDAVEISFHGAMNISRSCGTYCSISRALPFLRKAIFPAIAVQCFCVWLFQDFCKCS